MKIIFKSEKEKILEKLVYYGIKELPFLLIRFGKEKIRGYSGDLSVEEIQKIENSIGIELMGLYLFHEYDEGIRLSLDAIHLLKNQITKNIMELDDRQAEEWFRGQDIMASGKLKQENKGFKILRYKDDFIGCGKLTESRIVNCMPKERRLKGKLCISNDNNA